MTSTASNPTDGRGRPRVVVTGIGLKSPAGNDVASFWETVLAGRSTAATITAFDPSDIPVTFACEVVDYDPVAYLGPKESRRLDRFSQLAFGAAADALADAGDVVSDPARCAVVAGTGIGGLHTLEDQIVTFHDKGAARVSPFLVPMMMPNAAAALIGMQFGWTGPNTCVTTACAAGSHAIGEALRLVRDGSADVVVAGGTEAAITPVALSAFHRMGALSGRADDPSAASRPFDVDRDGFVMGEGAGFVILERLDHALARGARIYGEVAGYGRNCDAYHITAPAPGGAGAVACMQQALDDAALAPSAIGHVNAHGTSTPLNDAAEAQAVAKVLGDGTLITSTKGVTGHLIGAAGAVEAIASLLALRDGVVPPVANHVQADADANVDVVSGAPRPCDAAAVLSNSFGFGGHNATLIFASVTSA